MQKMYEALVAAHPGYQVVDVKIMANPEEADSQKAAKLDEDLAKAITDAREVKVDAFC